MIDQTRSALAAALSDVADVKGYVKRPVSPRPGDAWPVWRGGDRDQASGQFAWEWAIALVLPQDEQAAYDTEEQWIPVIVSAVGRIVYVDGVSPANLNTDASPVYGLLFTTRSE
jgi:hypothetical protein